MRDIEYNLFITVMLGVPAILIAALLITITHGFQP
jgi:hypothetical protein